MAVVDRGASGQGSSFSEIVNDQRYRSVFYQIVVAVVVMWAGWYLFSNTAHNLEARGMSAGFGFLGSTAGFSIAFSVIPYEAGDSYLWVYLVGITNTLLLAVVAIIFSTLIGFFVGVLRLSKNWLISQLAAWYVEIIRNTPLLLQILFWYLAVFAILPRPKQSIDVFGLGIFELNNRGFYFPAPVLGELFWLTMATLLAAIVVAYGIAVWAKKRQNDTGERFPVFWTAVGIVFGAPLVMFVITGSPLEWDIPALKGFNFRGGGSVPPAFCAVFIALVVYHACYVAEMVRAGILSVSHGQTEASYSLGLKPGLTLRLVIIPQAMRAIVPPLISLWMNVVKNSSLAIAVGYPDLVAVFMQTSLNQSGHAIEIVAMVMLFYMTVSLTISGALNYYNKLVQLKER
ncbi:amino acid ABC transporter permease [Nisaea acidiphila]|uniref:Amino acid ABC transporter permease n=1 Tax=Nisaea acidiphila TaxID=1862145 RepID=A0A9J7AT72_9PROT|nr:amino acid ABC transporter permease [Nisaea acidiphila]UUX50058.1 amino acid ABC transporter permease [Nisaea acidiphila]